MFTPLTHRSTSSQLFTLFNWPLAYQFSPQGQWLAPAEWFTSYLPSSMSTRVLALVFWHFPCQRFMGIDAGQGQGHDLSASYKLRKTHWGQHLTRDRHYSIGMTALQRVTRVVTVDSITAEGDSLHVILPYLHSVCTRAMFMIALNIHGRVTWDGIYQLLCHLWADTQCNLIVI